VHQLRRVSPRRALLRQACVAVAGLALAPALAACGRSPAPVAQPTAPPVKLTYLHQWSPQQGHGPITDTLAARFRQQHPSIDIQPVYAANYYQKLTTVLAGGDWPDVVTYNLAQLAELVATRAVVAAEDLAKGQYRYDINDLVVGARDLATFNGKLMAMPYVLNNSGLVYNQTLYKRVGLDPAKPPATWDDLVAQAQRLTNHSGTPPIWGTVFPKGTADAISPLLAYGRPTPKLVGWQQIITLLATARDDAAALKKSPLEALTAAALAAAPLIKQG
jgi:ABC-type glycerol-3-phosphate transport system substrate-binding protein